MSSLSQIPIVLIVGKKGAGKDTLASQLIAKGWKQFAFADTMKEALCPLMGWTMDDFEHPKKEEIDPRWNTSPRQMCQLFGTEFLRIQCSFFDTTIYHPTTNIGFQASFHIKRLHMKLCDFIQSNPTVPGIIITDGRFHDELSYVRDFLQGQLWKIERDSLANIDQHASEANIDKFPTEWFHNIIKNNGTFSELHNCIKNLEI